MNTPQRSAPGPVLDAGVVLLLFAFALLLCAPVLAGRVPIASDTLSLWAPWSQLPHAPAHNTALTDSAHQYLAWEVFARNSLASGQWPLWDTYSFSGFPFAANSQYHLYYPVTWLLWLLPLPLAIQLQAIFNLVLSGTGMYLFCRVLGVSRVGSLVAGLTFEGSGMLQTAIDAPFIACVFGWLPWLLLAATQAITLRSLRWAAFGALLAGLQATAGNLQWVLYSYFVVACWVVWLSLTEWWPPR